MANLLKLAFNRQAPNTLAQVGGFASSFPPLFQFDQKDIVVQVFDPGNAPLTGGTGSSFVPVDYTGLTLRVTMSDQPKGNAAANILAGTAIFPWVPAGAGNAAIVGNNAGYFAGTLDLSLAALSNFIGAAASGNPWLEFAVRENVTNKPLWLGNVTVLAVSDQGQLVNPANPQLYPTLAEIKAGFMAKYGTAADTKVMLSPDGTKGCLFYFGNDGVPHFDPLNPVPAAQSI